MRIKSEGRKEPEGREWILGKREQGNLGGLSVTEDRVSLSQRQRTTGLVEVPFFKKIKTKDLRFWWWSAEGN